MTEARNERALGTLDFAALALNGVIGSSVYLLLGPMAQAAGAASIFATILCAGMCLLVALCFAELSSMFREDGGAYLYGRIAFGRTAGWAIGWMSLAESVITFAAVAVGFASAVAELFPSLKGGGEKISAAVLVLFFAVLNAAGVRAGSRSVVLLTVLKTLPLVALAVLGLPRLSMHVLADAVHHVRPLGGLGKATFLAAFMLSGFEYASVPAGTAKDPQRAIPRALVMALLGATLLYVLLQWLLFSVTPGFMNVEQPMPQLAQALTGAWGGKAIALAAAISMAGFCAGSALVGPRYVTALAEAGYLFRGLDTRNAKGTPVIAILLSGAVAAVLSVTVNFRALVDIGTFALFAQYLPAALAVWKLRRSMPDQERRYRVPGPAWLIPGLAAAASTALLVLSHPQWAEWRVTGKVMALGAVVWAASARQA